MLQTQKMLSVNQTHAKIKYIETWKADNYPIQMEKRKTQPNGRTTRGVTNQDFIMPNTPNTFIGDATRMWNKAPESIQKVASTGIAKKAIKTFCSTLPI